MGIKFFFSWLVKTFPTCKTSLKNIDVLGLDLNGIIHSCAQFAFRYGKYESAPKLFFDDTHEIYDIFYCEIKNQIIEHVKNIHPKKVLLLYMDGVAGASKLNQQRQRRFKSSSNSIFDSNQLSTGTILMERIANKIRAWIKAWKAPNGNKLFSHLKIYFSDSQCAGEGEHKIFKSIKSLKYKRSCVVGMDADLIMLGLAAKQNRPELDIFIYKEDPFRIGTFYTVSITAISSVLKNINVPIGDFILLWFFCGNDFLPCQTSIRIEMNMDKLFHLYVLFKAQQSPELQEESLVFELNEQEEIQTPQLHSNISSNLSSNLSEFIHYLAKHEYELLQDKWKDSSLIKEDCFENSTTMEEFCEQYSTYFKCGASPLTPQCEDDRAIELYCKGLDWTMKYYQDEIPSWNWYYPYSHAPTFTMISLYLDSHPDFFQTIDFSNELENEPLTPFEQLLVILPRDSPCIPAPLRCIVNDEEFDHYYPSTVDIITQGKKYEWEYCVDLPMTDIKKIKERFAETKHLLSEDEQRRNKRTKTLKFV